MSKPLDRKLALVTGASRGIGYAVAKAYAEAGAHVIAVARTVGGLEELDDDIQKAGGSATLVPMDLKDFEGIDRLGAALYDRWGKLDFLIANAGILGEVTPVGHIDPKVFDDIMAVNVTANWRLLRSLDPLLRQSEAAKIFFISSGLSKNFRPFMGAYSMTKAALNAMAFTYARETEKTDIKTLVVNPGPVRTALRAQAYPGEEASTLTQPKDFAPTLIEFSTTRPFQSGAFWSFVDQEFLDI